jgi:hypothetical protein
VIGFVVFKLKFKNEKKIKTRNVIDLGDNEDVRQLCVLWAMPASG